MFIPDGRDSAGVVAIFFSRISKVAKFEEWVFRKLLAEGYLLAWLSMYKAAKFRGGYFFKFNLIDLCIWS